jgi:hypothetical protein
MHLHAYGWGQGQSETYRAGYNFLMLYHLQYYIFGDYLGGSLWMKWHFHSFEFSGILMAPQVVRALE